MFLEGRSKNYSTHKRNSQEIANAFKRKLSSSQTQTELASLLSRTEKFDPVPLLLKAWKQKETIFIIKLSKI